MEMNKPITESNKFADQGNATAMPVTDKEWEQLSSDAKQATAIEHELTFFQGIKLYRKAVGWSVALSTTMVMEGYDNALITNFFGLPSFQKKYGTYFPGVGYQVEARWQVALALATNIGLILGSFMNNYLSERFGYRKVMLVSYTVMSGLIFITFFAPSTPVLFLGEVLIGFPWGIAQSCATSYASDICPLVLRGHLTMYVNSAGNWTVASQWHIAGSCGNTTEWSYRIPFAIQWIWPVPLFCVVCFAPESP